jgi:TonB family protein
LTYSYSSSSGIFIAAPEDRVFVAADPARLSARRRFISLLIIAFTLHVFLLVFLFSRDRTEVNREMPEEIPVEIVTEQPPPPPEEKKPEEKKPEKQEKPQPEKPKIDYSEKPAFDAPRTANQETEKRLTTEQVTQGPTQEKPVTGAQQATPEKQQSAAATPEPAEKTVSLDTPDKPDAEPLDKATPEKAQVPQQKAKPTKDPSKTPNDQKAAVARQLAALAPAPKFSFATQSKVTPVEGGTEDMRYLTVVWGMILRQKHDPPSIRTKHINGLVVVGFFLDETGRMVHEALYRTSGYPEIDAEALAAVKRAAPFPAPPPGTRPHLTATIEFKE